MRWSPPEQNAQPPSFGDGPLPVSSTTPTSGDIRAWSSALVQLVDRVRPERVAHLGPVERDPHGAHARDVAVVGDVRQVAETVDAPPRFGFEGIVTQGC